MIRLLIIFFSITSLTFGQNVDSIFNALHQSENIIKFADHLFCEEDYLRSANEYLRIDKTFRDEKINFKIALSLSAIGDYSESKDVFSKINKDSPYYKLSRLEVMKILFLEEKFIELSQYFQTERNLNSSKEYNSEKKLYSLSFLKDQQTIPTFKDFIKSFDADEENEVEYLYQLKLNSPNKNPVIASVLSAILPGAGKFYTGEISDGILAFITTGLFSFLAYDNFKSNHDFRGWLFSGLAAMFYAGNVYGSYASAQIYNARVKFEFNLRLDSFLKSNIYFTSPYDFCK